MSKWDELSMAEKAEMMKVAVRQGITNLPDIKQRYNEFAEGGDTDWSYNSWKRQIAEHMGIRPDEDNTYDYEAYFKKYAEEAWRMLKGDPTAHFPDEFKTVYHPTFSSKSVGNDGSIYSGVRNPKTNPQGLVGGTWSPDYHTFTMSPDGYRGPVSMDDRKWYLEDTEDNGVVLREADGSLPIYDGIPWGGVLPNVTIYGNKHSLGVPLVEAAMNEYKNGGGIHIKKENRGKFTRLKERTGHSATWFKEHGTPAQKKMATFALNTRHWKHEDGGNLYEEGGLLDWIKNIFSSDPRKYKAADGKVFNTAEDAAKHNSSLVEQGRLYQQRDSKSLGVRRKLVPRKPNTSSTSLKSTILENSMYLGLDANRERTGYRTKAYDIPYGTKEIRVKPKGTTLPFNVSVNALDSIAKYAGVTGTPIQTALGLPYQETTFGRNPLINYESLGDKYSATDLGNANYFKAFGSIPAEYLVRDFRYNGDLLIDGKRDEPIPMDTPPLQHAFEYFNAGKYNTKANNHTGKVKAAGNAFWNETTGSLQNWWNTEGKEWYNKGAKQIKR